MGLGIFWGLGTVRDELLPFTYNVIDYQPQAFIGRDIH